jgi:hypothetical protein
MLPDWFYELARDLGLFLVALAVTAIIGSVFLSFHR